MKRRWRSPETPIHAPAVQGVSDDTATEAVPSPVNGNRQPKPDQHDCRDQAGIHHDVPSDRSVRNVAAKPLSMNATLVLTARSSLEELSRIADQIAGFLDSVNADTHTVFAVQFALEELFSNVVHYAFDDDQVGHPIGIRIEADPGGLTLIVEDDGRTFDPLSAPVPDTSLPVDQRPIGGLGLFITQRLASSIGYERVGGNNRVTVRFIRKSDAA